ncbi:hypothetical protein CEXT_218741 [Caerostris extrusa]|uniref:Uncharacterized protein n=1 Tax=Caerostris extrusa TaxID=172846 RepID=A0AAV4XCG1_CAEEX|nr:hypothetical protein CEXT_218741 [Caerostris extrusa]
MNKFKTEAVEKKSFKINYIFSKLLILNVVYFTLKAFITKIAEVSQDTLSTVHNSIRDYTAYPISLRGRILTNQMHLNSRYPSPVQWKSIQCNVKRDYCRCLYRYITQFTEYGLALLVNFRTNLLL